MAENYAVRELVNTRRSFGFGLQGRHWGWRGDHRGPWSVVMRLSQIWHELCSFTTERSITFVDWRLVRAPAARFPRSVRFLGGSEPVVRHRAAASRDAEARVGRDTETAY
jgi:hypothetical protein